MKMIRTEKLKYIRPWALLIACFLGAPLLTRLFLIFDDARGQTFQMHDLAGFASDISVSLVAVFLFVLLHRLKRVAARITSGMLIFVWCVFHYSNYEHVLANSDIVSLSYAKYLFSPTFLFGSALVVSNPLLLIILLAGTGAVLFVKPVKTTRIAIVIFATVFFTGIGVKQFFTSVLNPRWRCYNVVHANMQDIVFTRFRKIDATVFAEEEKKYKALLQHDLNGAPFVTIGKKRHNVLLIVLEGCCGGMLPSMRGYHGISSDISMPKLDSIAQANILYSNYITHQRQTNRGMFTLLSGSYEKLNSSTPKMTEAVTNKNTGGQNRQEYLPQFLAKNGYTTTYIQAAPLPYMLKDVFMKIAGFKHIYGTKWFKYAYSSNYWGIDDKAFFEQVYTYIKSQKKKKKPWFITLLTVGTHHPLNIPEEYGNVLEETKQQRAYSYLDEAISDFIVRLRKGGILKNTLVVLTCDESCGVKDLTEDPPGKRLCQQWGLLAVLHPKDTKIRVNEKCAQIDVALSIADYLGLAQQKNQFSGRSIFRKYSEERDIYFANTYNHVVGKFTKKNTLEICDENLISGELYETFEDKLFSLKRKLKRKLSPEEKRDIACFRAISNSSIVDMNQKERAFDFYSGITHAIEPGRQKTLLGGQFFTIPKNCAVSACLKGRILSDTGTTLFLKHDLAAKSGQVRIIKYMPKELKGGDYFSVQYDFYTPEEFYSSEFRVTAQLTKGLKAILILDEASLSYTVRPPTPVERKSFFRRYDKNVGRDLGACIVVASQDSTAADTKL